MADLDKYISDEIDKAGCEVERDQLLNKEDVNAADACELPDPEGIDGPSDALLEDLERRALEEIQELEDQARADAAEFEAKMKECVEDIERVSEEMAEDAERLGRIDEAMALLRELMDNMIPLKAYHQKRYDTALNVDTIDQDTIDKLRLKPPLILETAAKAKAKTLDSDTEEFSSAIDVGFKIDLLATTLDQPMFSVGISFKGAQRFLDNAEILDKDIILGSPEIKFAITDAEEDEEFSGRLYSDFYNKLEDPINNFFTLEERGLTNDKRGTDPQLLAQARDISNQANDDLEDSIIKTQQGEKEFYIKDNARYTDFFKTFPERMDKRLAEVKPGLIDAESIEGVWEDMASAEMSVYVRDYFNDDDDGINAVRAASKAFLDLWGRYQAEMDRLAALKDELSQKMSPDAVAAKMKAEVPCVGENAPEDTEEPPQEINLTESLKENDITEPDITKHCYWARFAKLATLYGLLPFPDVNTPGSLRYWPVGLKIPTPAKIVNIPLPIIWLPLATISSSFGILVIFIGLCGIIPAPYVFFVSKKGTKKFVITLRGSKDPMGSDSNDKLMKESLFISAPEFGKTVDNPLEANAYDIPADTFEELAKDLKKDILTKVDSSRLPDLERLQEIKASVNAAVNKDGIVDNINERLQESYASLDDVKEAVREDMKSFIDSLSLPKVQIPKDESSTEKKDAFERMREQMGDFLSLKFKSPEFETLDVKDKVIEKVDAIIEDLLSGSPSIIDSLPTNIDLSKSEHFQKIKDLTENVTLQALDDLQLDTAFTSLSMIPSVTISGAFQCERELDTPPPFDADFASLQASAVGQFSDVIQKMENVDLINALGYSRFERRNVASVLKDWMKVNLPSLPAPKVDFGMDHVKGFTDAIKNSIKSAEFKVEIPKFPLLKPLKIDLETIKPALKGAVDTLLDRNFDLFTAALPVDLTTNFGILEMQPIDIKVTVKNLVESNLDRSLETFESAYKVYSAAKGLRGFDVNFMDLIMAPLKVAVDLAKALAKGTDLNNAIEVPDPRLMPAALKLMEAFSKLPFIVPGALAAFGAGEIARALHPVLNYDDLPPWPRLTLDNPLFVLFLDEFCNVAKSVGGFKEKFLP